MKKVIFSLEMPQGTSYVGGIAFIINQYFENRDLFLGLGYDVEIFDETNCNVINCRLPSKLKNVLNLSRQITGMREVVSKNPEAIIHIHSSIGWTLLKDLFIIKAIRKMRHGKIVLSIHFADQEKILIKNPILRKLELKVINQYVNHVVFLSEKTKNAFIKTGLNESKASVLYTFHNFGGAILEKSSIGLNAPLRILFVGSIDRRKGILDLLEALSQSTSSDYILDICGQINDKSIKDKYEQMKDILGEKIVEHGYVTGELKKRIFQQADVLVLPSYGEGMPIVIMEAMASGNAIICTNVGAIPEIIKPENGFLLKPGDIEALRNSIMLLNSDRELLETMKKTNRKTGQEYDLYSNVRKLCSIYGELQ